MKATKGPVSKVQAVYAATSQDQQVLAYDAWAQDYERDLRAQGYTIPAHVAALFARFTPTDTGPFLDAGCGTGLQVEPLIAAGYRGFTGLDLSAGMLNIARQKGMYDTLVQGALGGRLAFADNQFAATLTAGTITQGHAPAGSFIDLTRVTRPGGRLIFALRCDPGIDREYNQILDDLVHQGLWQRVYQSPEFPTMPLGETEIYHKCWVFEVR